MADSPSSTAPVISSVPDAATITHEDIDIDESEEAEALVLRVNDGRRVVPTFEVDGRFFACSPYNKESLAAELKDLQKS